MANLLLLDPAASRLTGTAVPVDLAEVVAAVVTETSPQARARGVDVEIDVAPVRVSGDPRQLARALRNLIDNGIKFSAAGSRVRCRVTEDDGQARILVTDTGIGIPADDLAGLFTPFHRGANAMEKAVQGPGLGLAIVRNIVTEHGGTVEVTSELGAGSTFTVSLPAMAAEPAVAGHQA